MLAPVCPPSPLSDRGLFLPWPLRFHAALVCPSHEARQVRCIETRLDGIHTVAQVYTRCYVVAADFP